MKKPRFADLFTENDGRHLSLGRCAFWLLFVVDLAALIMAVLGIGTQDVSMLKEVLGFSVWGLGLLLAYGYGKRLNIASPSMKKEGGDA